MNILFACSSTLFALLLLLLYPARKLAAREAKEENGTPKAVYKALRIIHPAIGVLTIPVVFIHCRIAAQAAGESSGLGAVLLILLILLAVSYCLRKPLGRHWKKVHQVLAALFMLLTLCHVVLEIMT